MSFANFPRYVFSKHSEPDLLLFLEAAQNQCKSNCNLQDAEILNTYFPLDKHTKEKLESTRNKTIVTICIDDSDDDKDQHTVTHDSGKNDDLEELVSEAVNSDILAVSTTEDVCALIIENAETEKRLPVDVISDLQNLPDHQIKDVFVSLITCTVDTVVIIGESLLDVNLSGNKPLLIFYIEELLINKMCKEYSINLEKLVNKFYTKYPDVFVKIMLERLITETMDSIKVFVQYVGNTSNSFKIHVLREHLSKIEKLQDVHIVIIENLLNSQVDGEILKVLVDVMSNQADEFSSDKLYGKLLHTVIQLLGSAARRLEQPLKYIIGRHRSIWKLKAEKLFDSNFSDSMLLTQSVRF